MNTLSYSLGKQLSHLPPHNLSLFSNEVHLKEKNEMNNHSFQDKIYLFCYGSNSLEQLKERVKNDNLEAFKAYLPGYVRIFAGYSKKWNGGVATLMKTQLNHGTKGSIVQLSEYELQKVDKFEGSLKDATPYGRVNNVYYRKHIKVKNEKNEEISCVVYLRNNTTWVETPSMSYLEAIKKNLLPFWFDLDENNKIIIYDEYLNKIDEYH